MKFEQNYIDIFNQNRALIDQGSAGALNALRDKALDCLERNGLPHKGLEEYLHTDVAHWFEPDWGMNLSRLDMHVDLAQAFRCNVPNLSTLLYFLANDEFALSDTAAKASLPDGVFVGSLRRAAKELPAIVESHYGTLADMDRPGIAAVNTMFAQDGLTESGMKAESGQSVRDMEKQVYGTTLTWGDEEMSSGQAQAQAQTMPDEN